MTASTRGKTIGTGTRTIPVAAATHTPPPLCPCVHANASLTRLAAACGQILLSGDLRNGERLVDAR
eukprot:6202277-Pleurochrysis_carterae.AAC.1